MLIRTFISIDVPVTDEMESLFDRLRHIGGIRVPPSKQIHLTLKFLGDTDDKKVVRLCSTLKEALSEEGSFEITVEGLGAFPDRKNPRIVWLGIKDQERLMAIAEKVDDTVKKMGLKCDDKRFSPHITVGRTDRRVDLKELFKESEDVEFCIFRCDRVDVMKSVLTPKGAIHSVIESIQLD